MTRLNDRAIHEGKSNKVIFDHLEKKKIILCLFLLFKSKMIKLLYDKSLKMKREKKRRTRREKERENRREKERRKKRKKERK